MENKLKVFVDKIMILTHVYTLLKIYIISKIIP